MDGPVLVVMLAVVPLLNAAFAFAEKRGIHSVVGVLYIYTYLQSFSGLSSLSGFFIVLYVLCALLCKG